jgi:hypothetical protein
MSGSTFLGRIVGAPVVASGRSLERRIGSEQDRALRKVEPDMALEMNGKAEPGAWRKDHGSAAGGRCGIDGFVDGGRIDGFAIADSTIVANVEEAGPGG